MSDKMTFEEVLEWARTQVECADGAYHLAILYADAAGCCCVCTGKQKDLRAIVKTFDSYLNEAACG